MVLRPEKAKVQRPALRHSASAAGAYQAEDSEKKERRENIMNKEREGIRVTCRAPQSEERS